MRARFWIAASTSVATAVFVDVNARAQSRAATAAQPASAGVPRTADGHPDLQGTYDLGTLTPVERRAGTPLVLTDAAQGRRRIAGTLRQRRRL